MARYLAGEAETDRRRAVLNPIRALYHTPRWRALRWEVLVEAHFRCVLCGRTDPVLTPQCDALAPLGLLGTIKGKAPGFVADHKVPHRGDEALFWDRGNLQCLCAPCHNRPKQREEQSSRRAPGG